MARDTVLVTGGSGFVGSHVILQLLDAGHVVRTTLRSLAKADAVREMLREAGVDPARLTFFAADLQRDDGWAEAVSGCAYVVHVASPIPAAAPKTEDELIVPAGERFIAASGSLLSMLDIATVLRHRLGDAKKVRTRRCRTGSSDWAR